MPNRLSAEKSPYLRQHAHNPVAWYPWCPEAFAAAKEENKPVFLSIGYSTCHWCHVMERESFENEEVARYLNEHFVSIKVDREEHPDVDRVYMNAVQAMTGSGGWPLTVFLTSDLKPFFGGTYFPPMNVYGRPSFLTVLRHICEIFTNDPDHVREASNDLLEYLRNVSTVEPNEKSEEAHLTEKIFTDLSRSYDPRFAGFGGGPKFPRPAVFHFLARYYYFRKEKKALSMMIETLKAMAKGGINDHIGGGFHRYSVDAQWRVPHFEKMLYDQAQLVQAYLETYQITRDRFFADVAVNILEYVQRDLLAPEGGFYSAEDADSPEPENQKNKSEGAFYIWTLEELKNVLGTERAEIFSSYYGITANGNALEDPHGEFRGKNILYINCTIDEMAIRFSMKPEKINELLTEIRIKLISDRSKRPRPLRDEKILTGWNGLMISGFAKAAILPGMEQYLRIAENAARFILREMYDSSRDRLFRRYCAGEKRYAASLQDYSFFIQSLLDLFDAAQNEEWLGWALRLQKIQDREFWDEQRGGYFESTEGNELILVRMKEMHDGAEPAGNSIAAENLYRLLGFSGDELLADRLEKLIRVCSGIVEGAPNMMPRLVSLFLARAESPVQIVLRGKDKGGMKDKMFNEVRSRFLPYASFVVVDENREMSPFLTSSTLFKLPTHHGTAWTAYICRDFRCEVPATDADQFILQLDRLS